MGGAAARLAGPSWSSIRRPASSPFIERLAGPRRIVDLRDRLGRAALRHGLSRVLHRRLPATRRRTSTRTAGRRSGRRSPGPPAPCAATTSSAASSRPSARCSTTTATASAARRRRRALDGSVVEPHLSRCARAAGAPPTDEVLVELLQRRASLVAEVEELQVKKAFMSPDEYAREFERIMLALARVGREIRARNPS